jgi:hypothetical protein
LGIDEEEEAFVREYESMLSSMNGDRTFLPLQEPIISQPTLRDNKNINSVAINNNNIDFGPRTFDDILDLKYATGNVRLRTAPSIPPQSNQQLRNRNIDVLASPSSAGHTIHEMSGFSFLETVDKDLDINEPIDLATLAASDDSHYGSLVNHSTGNRSSPPSPPPPPPPPALIVDEYANQPRKPFLYFT